MSELIKKLEQAVASGPTKPMGFGFASPKARPAQLVLAILLARPGPESVEALIAGGADAAVTQGVPAPEFVTAAKEKKLLWGSRAAAARSAEVESLKTAGCDFLIYGPDSPVALVEEKGIGQVLEVEPRSDSSTLGSEHLAPGALYLPLDDMPYLSIRRMALCERLARMGRKPILVQVYPTIAEGELAALCEAGAAGIVVEPRAAGVAQLLERLRRAINGLPARGRRTKPKAEAVLPKLHLVPTAADEGEPPEEPDEGE